MMGWGFGLVVGGLVLWLFIRLAIEPELFGLLRRK